MIIVNECRALGATAYELAPLMAVVYLSEDQRIWATELTIWSCGHVGYPSIRPALDGNVQCTECANRMIEEPPSARFTD